jgi:hypothetical protein
MKVHAVACFELKWQASLVSIAFLSCLGSFQIGLDAMDYLFDLSDKVRTKDRPLARLNLVQRCATLAIVKCFKWCHLEAVLIAIVVIELS